jgi:prepilin-type processing-associated H-X9-DG protein
VNVLRCPSDLEALQPTRANGRNGGRYTLSYAVNWTIGSAPHHASSPSPRAEKINQIKNASEKVLFYEEDERSLDDGQASIIENSIGAVRWINVLAVRHDWVYRRQFDPPRGPNGQDIIPNSAGKGNAGFADGHGDYVERKYVHSKRHALPRDLSNYPTVPEPPMR